MLFVACMVEKGNAVSVEVESDARMLIGLQRVPES